MQPNDRDNSSAKMDELKPFPSDLVQQTVSWLEQLVGDERLMVIVATARLDDLLKRLLQSTMLHHPGGSDNLFDADRPLGTFSSRILLAYRLGLLSREFESFLQTLRKLRNDAAHAVQHIDLTTSPHLDRVIHLQSLASKGPLWGMVEAEPVDPKKVPVRSLFLSLMVAVFNGECAVLSAKPFKIETVCSFGLLRTMADGS